ncbi:tyrosine-type recombinase/integrase [Alteriqipengyuania sp.]|uniref:tyrosine-type recombinase/integrase n=1 Tax=Alteriqipengyuania sp. TaxID=2800692 RepID=UPI0035115C26
MPLEPYARGSTWWARGRIEYNGRKIGRYVRCSTGATSEAGARDWCREEEERRIRAFLIGEEAAERPLTFADAVITYDADPLTAKFLIPIVEQIGDMPVNDITPEQVRDLGVVIYPHTGTDLWHRQVITPVRAVINHLHHRDRKRCNPIRIRAYTQKERLDQDKRRGKRSRRERRPGSWPWLTKFCAHATPRVEALALLMFVTGARVGQAIAMHPHKHLDLANARVCIPGAKGLDDRWITIPDYLVAKLEALAPRVPRGWDRRPANLRVFGYADRGGPRKEWNKAIKEAGIEPLSFHEAGRHGYGQEMKVRQGVDSEAAKAYGGWSRSSRVFDETYTHAEDAEAKILAASRTGRVQAGLEVLPQPKEKRA